MSKLSRSILAATLIHCAAGWGKNTYAPPPPPPPVFGDPAYYFSDPFFQGLSTLILLSLTLLYLFTTGADVVKKRAKVVLVGCGMPKKSMGWYHLTQLMKMKDDGVDVVAVVEPFFCGICSDVPGEFTKFRIEMEREHGITFYGSPSELPELSPDTLCLLAGRTCDNPKYFEVCLDKGAKCIYLEKPGAETVEQLERMKNLALSRTVPCRVFVGFNKNVTSYVTKALKFAKETPNSHINFVHNNSYKPEELGECFKRNSEGMLKNMAIHELCLLVSFYDVRVNTVFKITADKELSSKRTIDGVTDLASVSFTVTTLAGASATVTADRCGGNVSYAIVNSSAPPKGKEIKRFAVPTPEEKVEIDAKIKADPEMMPYFFIQSDDYWTLKKDVINAFRAGEAKAGNVATIEVAIEALKLAEFATRSLMRQL